MDMMQSSQLTNGIGGVLSGLFSDSGAPYQDAMDQFQKYGQKAENVQNPFLSAGKEGMGNFQNWLKSMQDPSAFINHLMGSYNESPWAKFQQQQAMRAGTNAASAGGLSNGMGGAGIGSTPFAQQLQQNAQNISSQDMNQWLQNVLGINTQFGGGQKDLMQGGQNSANALTNMYGDLGKSMAEQSYNKGAAENNDFSNLLSGGLQLGAMAFGL